MPSASPRLFLSYARSDGEAFARTLRERLEAAGISLWQDRTGMEGGRDWWLQITAALDQVEFMVLAMTPAALRSDLVRREWRYARQHGVCVYPVMAAAGLDFAALPRWMRDIHFYDLEYEWAKFLNDLNTRCRATRVPFMVEDQPDSFVPRKAEFEQLLGLLLDREREEPVAITTALRGAGGFGKTALARALCHDEEVQNAFNDGILWVTLGQSPGDLTGRIEDLIYLLCGERPGFASVEAATARFAELLADRDILMVIDDVWNGAHLKPFLQGGQRCARLITTRGIDTLPPATKRVDVDAMRRDEAAALLRFALPAGCDADLHALAARLGEWPLLLTLVNGALRDRVAAGQALAGALAYVNKALDKRGPTFFDAADAVARHQAVSRTIEVSLELLSGQERARFAELAVFPEDADVPLATLEAFWGKTGGLDDLDTEALAERLNRLSLLVSFDPAERQLRLHDVIRRYLIARQGASMAALHAALLDALRPASGRWADLASGEPYLWGQLAGHLRGAGCGAELVATVRDLGYLSAKTLARNALAVEADLLAAEEEAPADDRLRALRRSFVKAGHILNRGLAREEIQVTLASRIDHVPGLREYVFAPALAGPYLSAALPLPDLPHAALVRTLMGHSGGVWGCAISPDGRLVASASWDQTVKIWDARSGAERFTLMGHTGWVKACAFSPDGRRLVSAGYDRRLRVWDATTGEPLLVLVGHTDAVTDCAWSADGSFIVSASLDETVRLWDASTGELRRSLAGTWVDDQHGGVRFGQRGHWAAVHACAVSPDGSFVVSASSDETLKIWDVASGEERATLRGHTAAVTGCAISGDGTFIVSAGADRTVRVWDAVTGAPRILLRGHRQAVTRCAVSPDGEFVISASADGAVTVWTGLVPGILQGHADWVNACAVSTDGTTIVSASSDRTLKLWDFSAAAEARPTARTPRLVNACALSPDGKTLLTGSSDAPPAQVWDALPDEDGITAPGTPWLELSGHEDSVRGCAISPDGRLMATASADKTIHVWERESEAPPRVLRGHRDWVNACAFIDDGRRLISASSDGTWRLWDVASGTRLLTVRAHRDSVNALALSPSRSWLVTASADRTLKLWDLRLLSDVIELLGAGGLVDAFSAVPSPIVHHLLAGHGRAVNCCAISPDGKWLLSGSDDYTLKLWDRAARAERATLVGHEAWVNGCSVSPDGRLIASASSDHSLKVWSLDDTRCLTTLRVEGALSACTWLNDSRQLVAVGAGGVYFLRFNA